ncbi:MAG: cysteine desulfurase [Planctomycetes bacterium]|nr:cysteine desulfurase [Planctomycetota bacterium]
MSATTATPAKRLDVDAIRAEFPILHQQVHGKPLVYLDNAATKQKPRSVIESQSHYYERDNANIHRGVHLLSCRATDAYEAARARVRKFLNAAEDAEILFTRGTTEGINRVARSYGELLSAGDEILISHMEHHSNIVPWQMLAKRKGTVLKVAPIDDAGQLDVAAFERLLSPKTKLVSIVHQSNSLGTINPIAELIAKAHAVGAVVLVDAAQSCSHLKVDVRALDADFVVLSSHKIYGPTGVGVLYGKRALLDRMPPDEGGGDMILSVTFEKTIYNKLPHKFEAGTPNIAGVIGLGAAIDWVESKGLDAIAAHEDDVLRYGTQKLTEIPGLRIIGTAAHKASVLSFTLGDIHPHDVGTVLDMEGVAIRTGHHCTQPVMDRFGVPATARASLAVYNTRADVDALCVALHKAIEVLG